MTQKKNTNQRVKDLKKEFKEGVIVDSFINDDPTLIYTIEYEDEQGVVKTVEREPYQIIYL